MVRQKNEEKKLNLRMRIIMCRASIGCRMFAWSFIGTTHCLATADQALRCSQNRMFHRSMRLRASAWWSTKSRIARWRPTVIRLYWFYLQLIFHPPVTVTYAIRIRVNWSGSKTPWRRTIAVRTMSDTMRLGAIGLHYEYGCTHKHGAPAIGYAGCRWYCRGFRSLDIGWRNERI